MRNIRSVLAYDGSNYLGWQITHMGPSIEGELTQQLRQILQEPVQLNAASRTDAGVHAEGQVVNFLTANNSISAEKLKASLNRLLPKDLVVLQCEEAAVDFHATLHTRSKEYHYHLCCGRFQMPPLRRYSWHYTSQLDLEAMRSAAQLFIGEHDFSSFCNVRKNIRYADYIRTLYKLEIIPLEANRLRFEIHGDHFLYKMVRNLVGTLLYVGCGKLELISHSLHPT